MINKLSFLYITYLWRQLRWAEDIACPLGLRRLKKRSDSKRAFATSTPRYFLQVVALTSIGRQYASIAYDKD